MIVVIDLDVASRPFIENAEICQVIKIYKTTNNASVQLNQCDCACVWVSRGSHSSNRSIYIQF